MILAVMSDSHDNIWNMRKALGLLTERGAEMIVHCGDFVAPFMLREMAQAGLPVHGVFGNNDGDRHLLTRLSLTELTGVTLYDPFGELDVNGFTVGFSHYEAMARGLAASGRFNLCCYGHSHGHAEDRQGGVMLLNPGEIMGKDGSPGFCLVDTSTGGIERVAIQ